MGEDDPALAEEIWQDTSWQLEEKYEALLEELKSVLGRVGPACRPSDSDEEPRASVRDKMVDLLNRRSYIRNLVRDVNEALEN